MKRKFGLIFLLCFSLLLLGCSAKFNFYDDIPANSIWEYNSEDLYIWVKFDEDGCGTAKYRHIHYKNNQQCDAWATFGVKEAGFNISELINDKSGIEKKSLLCGEISFYKRNGYITIEEAMTVNTPYCECVYKDIELKLVSSTEETDKGVI